MSMLPPLPAGGIAVVGIPTEMGVGKSEDGRVLLTVHIPCGLFGFLITPEAADILAGELALKATAARTGLVLPDKGLTGMAGGQSV